MDGYPLENSLQRGIGRVISETVRRSSDRVDYTIGIQTEVRQETIEGVVFEKCVRDPASVGKSGTGRQSSDRPPDLPQSLRDSDVYHSSFFMPSPVEDIPKIQAVYDMIPEQFPKLLGRWGRREATRKRAAILQADVLVCISHATRDALLSVYPDYTGRIEVVHLGADHLACKQAIQPPPTDSPYVLFVGHRHTYKNFRGVIRALRSEFWPRGVKLRVVGRPLNIIERAQLWKNRVNRKVIWEQSVSDAELAGLYQSAAAFVFPSVAEGFGLPVIEAQINGCPLAASDTSVFREVAGDGAVFFDPQDPDDMARALARSIESRDELVVAGAANASRFTWDRAADQMVELYRSCQ